MKKGAYAFSVIILLIALLVSGSLVAQKKMDPKKAAAKVGYCVTE